MLVSLRPALATPSDQDDDATDSKVVSEDQLEIKGIIGQGGMGKIHLCNFTKNGCTREVALKTLLNGPVSKRELASLTLEVQILERVNHVNIVKTFGLAVTRLGTGMLLEFVPNGSYFNYFQYFWKFIPRDCVEIKKSLVPFKIRLLSEIIDAMNYLHEIEIERKILHLDLKGDNVLLSGRLNAKICDFGLSRLATLTELLTRHTDQQEERVAGTPGYIAPERFKERKKRPTSKCDVYSFGILEFTVLADTCVPYEGVADYDQLRRGDVCQDLRPDMHRVPNIYPEELTAMMINCWASDPNERPSFGELKEVVGRIKSGINNFDDQAVASMEEITRLLEKYCPCTSFPTSSKSGSHISPKYLGTAVQFETKSSFNPTPCYQSYLIRKLRSLPLSLRVTVALFLLILAVASAVTAITIVLTSDQAVSSLRGPNDDSDVNTTFPCVHSTTITNGSYSCDSDAADASSTCYFSCDKGYSINGSVSSTCSGGIWTHEFPSCVSACSSPGNIEHTNYTCTDDFFVGSTCNFSCKDPHKVIQGATALQCLANGSWSDFTPECVCPDRCTFEDNCSLSSSWKAFENTFYNQIISLHTPLTVTYAGNLITCSVSIHFYGLNVRFRGRCTNLKDGFSVRCGYYTDVERTAVITAAELIRVMVEKHQYPIPCDNESYKIPCPN